METLIPQECIKCCCNSKQYVHNFSSNFLSIDDTVTVPFEEIDDSMVILLEIDGTKDKLSHVKIIYNYEIPVTTFQSRLEKMIENESLEKLFIEQIKEEFLR